MGDQVRLVTMPGEFDRPGYQVHRDTRRVYSRLIERRRSVRVFAIDELGLPWISCRFRGKNGRLKYHTLAFNHGGWVRVRHRA